MNENTASKKALSLVLLVAGVVLMALALWMDFSKNYIVVNIGFKVALRGLFLVLGALMILAGLYLTPSVMHHRTIINIIFLFPLLFTFAVTVIVPMCVGIFYSFTDWNGVTYTKMVGFENYAAMFKEAPFIWSLLLTVLFVVVNMILVNVVAFLLALLCTTKLKGIGFFDMAAASVGSYQVICGKEIPAEGVDVNAIEMKCTRDGKDFNAGKGTDALGDQWGTLLKLINIIVRNGNTIEPGQFIISGAMGAMLPADPGNYTADFGSFGKIDFVVKKPE